MCTSHLSPGIGASCTFFQETVQLAPILPVSHEKMTKREPSGEKEMDTFCILCEGK